VRTARRPTSGNRPWLQHRRRRGRSRGLRCRSTTPRATRSTKLPAPIASAPPADDPVHETIEAVQPGAGEWGRHRVDPHTVAGHREVGGTIVSVPPNHVAPDHAEETRAKYAEWALGYCGSRTTDRRLHPDQPAPTMTVSDGVQPIHYQDGRPRRPASLSTTCAGSLFARLRGSRRSPIW